MSRVRYTEEFKIEAVRQVTERGHRVADVAERLGVSAHSLYQWRKRYGQADCTAVGNPPVFNGAQK